MAYRNRLTFEDFVCVFPWWVSAGLAVVSYFGMTYAHLFVGEGPNLRVLQMTSGALPQLAPMVSGFFVFLAVCSFLWQSFFGEKKVGERSHQPVERSRRMHEKHLPDKPSASRPLELTVRVGVKSLCPFCGHAMVLRTAKRGPNAGNPFWGCSRYPQCTGTRGA